jgi:hypothetical protein
MILFDLAPFKGRKIQEVIDDMLELTAQAGLSMVVLEEDSPDHVDVDSSRITVWTDEGIVERYVIG